MVEPPPEFPPEPPMPPYWPAAGAVPKMPHARKMNTTDTTPLDMRTPFRCGSGPATSPPLPGSTHREDDSYAVRTSRSPAGGPAWKAGAPSRRRRQGPEDVQG